eukprot:scaffold10018_cov117-Isochrysis_galbana.AAC.7
MPMPFPLPYPDPVHTAHPNNVHTQTLFTPKHSSHPNTLHTQTPFTLKHPSYFIPKYPSHPNTLHTQTPFTPKHPNTQTPFTPKHLSHPNTLHAYHRGCVGCVSGAALTRDEITEKLNAVPTFCLLNKDGFAVTVRGEDGSPTCSWYTDPSEARAVLAAASRDNPTVPGLHLGVAPLGIAFRCGRPRGEEQGGDRGRWDKKRKGRGIDRYRPQVNGPVPEGKERRAGRPG